MLQHIDEHCLAFLARDPGCESPHRNPKHVPTRLSFRHAHAGSCGNGAPTPPSPPPRGGPGSSRTARTSRTGSERMGPEEAEETEAEMEAASDPEVVPAVPATRRMPPTQRRGSSRSRRCRWVGHPQPSARPPPPEGGPGSPSSASAGWGFGGVAVAAVAAFAADGGG
eukprot:CAMPEP_0114526118 /NCGR_PEP_ID=MMETSP0109-20121206/22826_1 /TAXON_ID=29199 /ORGANISM="Chlorarachnion reptans, Strain CCCM449" /LENGTH=167 /DNA_ID=CAMNT_0001707823 /DNA_START=515 /DNA_END=1014 /DNA_ORIENTATION=+